MATGHPTLKLVLLTVATLPGWPTLDDIERASELTDGWAADALAELIRRDLVIESDNLVPARYGLRDGDGWGFTGERDGELLPGAQAPVVGENVSGHALGRAPIAL
jgi:hypothetical protein